MRQLLALVFALAACSGSSNSFHGATGTESEAESEGQGGGSHEGEAESEGGPGGGGGRESEAESEGGPTGMGGTPFEPVLGCTPPAFTRADGEPFVEVAGEIGLGLTGERASVCMLDYDGDGDPDLVVTPSVHVFRNDGGNFTEVTAAVGFGGDVGFAAKCLAFDYDSDGDPDLLIPSDGMTRLYENQGGVFADVSTLHGFGSGGLGESAGACDIELDGDLDVVIADFGSDGARTRLFVNVGGADNVFTEDAVGRGISASTDAKRSVFCTDLNGDYFPEIMLAGDDATKLYENRGDGTFVEATVDIGFAALGAHGIAAGDYDLDGKVDVAVGATGSRRSFIFHCNPAVDPLCREVSTEVGLGEPMGSKSPARGMGLFDFDQDGLVDLFVTRRGPSQLYWNEAGRFVEVGSADFDASPYSRGTAFGDIDGDGDVDIVVANSTAAEGAPEGAWGGGLVVYRNEIASGNWLRVSLVGTTSNRQGVGAVVTVTAASGCSYTSQETAGGSFSSTNEPVLHFGLGAAMTADVTVRWPSGATSTVAGVAVNQTITVTE